jgi:imidazolonepropionase-like amidohydrolase
MSAAVMRRVIGVAAVTAVVAACATAWGQDLTVKAPAQSRAVVIRGATIHPVSAAPIENGVIMLSGGKIEGLYTEQQFAEMEKVASWAAPGPLFVDGKGKHVYPGMIAPYTQLGLDEIAMLDASRDFNEAGDFSPEVRAIAAVNADSNNLTVTRSNGVLAAGVFPQGGTMPGQPAVIKLEGWTWEDMAVSRSIGTVIEWPSMRPVQSFFVRTPEAEQRKRTRQQIDTIDAMFRAAKSYVVAKNTDPSTPTDLRYEALRACVEGEPKTRKPVYITANDVDQINAAVAWAAEHELRCVIVGGYDAPLCSELLKKHDVPVIVQGTLRFPKRDDSDYNQTFALPAKLKELGVRFAISSGEETPHERNTPYAAGMAMAHGLSHDDAIRSVTLSAAEILGVADHLGSLEKGKDATVIVTTGSPLEITTQIVDAYVDGKRLDLSNKQTKLYEKYKERYRQMGELKNEIKK